MTQNHLGRAYSRLNSGDGGKHRERAIAAFRAALGIRRYRSLPMKWALTATDLAIALIHRKSGEPGENREEAFRLLKAVQRSSVYRNLPFERAMTEHNLAFVYANRLRGRPKRNIDKAVEGFRKALDVFDRMTFPFSRRHTASDLGDVLAEAGRWSEAAEAYSEAVDAFSTSYDSTLWNTSREAEIAAVGPLYRHAAFVRARLGEQKEAVVLLERGRARELRKTLDIDHLDFTELAKIEPEASRRLAEAAEDLRDVEEAARVRRLRADGLGAVASLEADRSRARETRALLEEALTVLRAHRPDLLVEPDWGDWVGSAVRDRVLVYLVPTLFGTCCLLIFGTDSKELTIETFFVESLTTETILGIFALDSDGDDMGARQAEWLNEAGSLLGSSLLRPLVSGYEKT